MDKKRTTHGINVAVQNARYKGAHVAADPSGENLLILMMRPKAGSFRNHPLAIPLDQAVLLRDRLNELCSPGEGHSPSMRKAAQEARSMTRELEKNPALKPENVKKFTFNDGTGTYRFVMSDDRVCLCPMDKLSPEMIDFVAQQG